MSDDIASAQVKLRKNGDLFITEEGQSIIIAHYDRTSGRLEFTTKENSVKLYNQCVARIGTVANGTEPSGLVIRSVAVKGDPTTALPANTPKRPKLGEAGDSAEDFVAWMIEHDLPQAIVRYGIYTDEHGKPIRKPVRRVIEATVDLRATHEDKEIDWVKTGPATHDKSPVQQQRELVEMKNAIIARRATALTFTPAEVVGGFQPDDDYEPAAAQEGEA